MGMPIGKRASVVQAELEDDDLDEEVVIDEEEEDEPEPKGRVAVVPRVTKAAGMPMAQIMGVDLDDEQVAEEMEAAIARGSSFGYKLDHIRAHLLNKDYQSASLTTKEALLATMIELVPLAEASLRKSNVSKGIYQFQSLVGGVRELLTDLDGERDLNVMVQSILDEAVRPVFLLLAQMIIQFSNSLKRQLRAELDDKKCKAVYPLVDEQVQELAGYVQGMFNEVQTRVNRKLDGK